MPRRGYYYAATHSIYLRADLSIRDERCTLAHELGHAYYGHECASNDYFATRAERAADIFAARLLITEDAYREAEAMYEGDIRGIAHELEVTQHMVTVWQDWWQQTHDMR